MSLRALQNCIFVSVCSDLNLTFILETEDAAADFSNLFQDVFSGIFLTRSLYTALLTMPLHFWCPGCSYEKTFRFSEA